MTSDLVERAKQIYETCWKHELERTHLNDFVAVEPDSGEYFSGKTLSEASAAAHAAYPDRRTFVLRVGHLAAIHIAEVTT